MIDRVLVKSYAAPPVRKRDILRYCGCRERVQEVEERVDECLAECAGAFTYKVCYREFPVTKKENLLDLSFTRTDSLSLSKNLEDCESIVLFAATVGIGIDRLIAKYGRLSADKALLFQAIGAERIESLCDLFSDETGAFYRGKGLFTRPRYSPGYGDFPLAEQKNVFAVLDCYRKIGLSLNESLLMSPTKSVTALIGVSKKACRQTGDACAYCEKKDCPFSAAHGARD